MKANDWLSEDYSACVKRIETMVAANKNRQEYVVLILTTMEMSDTVIKPAGR